MNRWRVTCDLISYGDRLAWKAEIARPGQDRGIIVIDDDAAEAVACAVRVVRYARTRRQAERACLLAMN